MSRMFDGIGLKELVQMWKAFSDSIVGWGFHIANARLFALDQMINYRLEHPGWNEEAHHPQMQNILLLIEYAKQATKNEKVIYLFAISEWFDKIIEAINESERLEERQREWRQQELMSNVEQVVNKPVPPDSMGDIPF